MCGGGGVCVRARKSVTLVLMGEATECVTMA